MIRRWLMMGLAAVLMGLAGCGGGCGADASKNLNSAKDRPRTEPSPDTRP